jgi:hypothetical protein
MEICLVFEPEFFLFYGFLGSWLTSLAGLFICFTINQCKGNSQKERDSGTFSFQYTLTQQKLVA